MNPLCFNHLLIKNLFEYLFWNFNSKLKNFTNYKHLKVQINITTFTLCYAMQWNVVLYYFTAMLCCVVLEAVQQLKVIMFNVDQNRLIELIINQIDHQHHFESNDD